MTLRGGRVSVIIFIKKYLRIHLGYIIKVVILIFLAAHREGEEDQALAGLIPSKSFQEQ